MQDPSFKGRASQNNPANRFAPTHTATVDDGWWHDAEPLANETQLIAEQSKSIVTKNLSPDVPFSQSINPYRGCEHGCIYCYARPSHAYWDFSPGLDFEQKIIYRSNAVELLEQFFANPRYHCEPICIGANTDAYQPAERQLKLTRQLLEVFLRYRHPVSIITKSQLIGRDLDILAELAAHNLVSVAVSVTTLENSLKRVMEPRAASPNARLTTIEKLTRAGIPVTALVAPIVPAVNDHEIESILAAVAEHGAVSASYIMLRLPHELKTLFSDWLSEHFPLRKDKVLNYLRAMRQGQLNQAEFGLRMSGQGVFAQIIKQRFKLACRQHGLNQQRETALETGLFQPPERAKSNKASAQLSLF